MRKVFLFSLALLMTIVIATAANTKLGGHGTYVTGGDINDASLNIGAQISADINETATLELSATRFTDADSLDNSELEVTSVALSLLLGTDVGEGIRVYIGGGVTYAGMDLDITDAEYYATLDGMNVVDWAATDNLTVAEAEILLTAFGVSADVEVENAFGWHVCGGLVLTVAENLEVFLEYRHSSTEIEFSITEYALWLETGSVTLEEDFDYGQARAGINLLL